jgi:hypothetical protein
MSKQVYMIHCEGQGDISIVFFKDRDIWEWIHHHEADLPESVIKAYLEDELHSGSTREEAREHLQGTSGSWSNDRALCLWDNVEGVVGFVSLSKAMQYVKDNDLDIIAEWSGYIY